MNHLTQERLKELAHYDPETGFFTWKTSKPRGYKAGDRFGNPNVEGYLQVKIEGRVCTTHRLAFLYMTGQIPRLVDHANRIKHDNRWANLRTATTAQNVYNRTVRCDASTGLKGVRYRKEKNLYQAYIRLDGKYKHLGNFRTADDASEFAQLAREMCHGEFVCNV